MHSARPAGHTTPGVGMRTLHGGTIRSALAAALLSLCAAPAVAQQATSALRVVVTDATTGEPLDDALVHLRGTRVGSRTGDGGGLVLRNLAPGTAVVEVSRLGYGAASRPVRLAPGATHDLAVELRVDPVALSPVTAEAANSASWARDMLESRGFFQRRSSGPGVFMVREDISRTNSRSMAQLLSRHQRLNVRYDAWTTAPSPRRRGMGPTTMSGCRPAYFVDGILVEGFDVNSIQPDNVEALEIYRGASELPPAFNRGTSGCGAVVIWSRVN